MHRFFLRQTTRDLHSELDTSISRLDLADGADYGNFIRIHAAALLPLEAALEAGGVEGNFPAWPRHRRSDALLEDLRGCGIGQPASDALPAIRNANVQMGVLYVLEGSRLGGKVLERQARGQEGRNAFLTHGTGRPLWQEFVSALERLPDEEAVRRELAEGAAMAFRHYLAAASEILGGMQRGVAEPVGSSENPNRIAAANRS